MALLNLCHYPWVCIGGFNFTINDSEMLRAKRDGNSALTNYLKELIFEFEAIDLGFFGNTFTWARRRWGSVTIKKRSDKRIASISWCLAFPKATMTHLGVINLIIPLSF